MATENETLLTWLRDAYALERKLIPELKAHHTQAADHPEIQARLDQHITETERHAAIVKGIIERLGGEVSTVKEITGQVLGFMMGNSTAIAPDRLVKNALAEFTMEHTEIASYTSLIAAAQHRGLSDVVAQLRTILADERAMAEWLEQRIPDLTVEYIHGSAPAGSHV